MILWSVGGTSAKAPSGREGSAGFSVGAGLSGEDGLEFGQGFAELSVNLRSPVHEPGSPVSELPDCLQIEIRPQDVVFLFTCGTSY